MCPRGATNAHTVSANLLIDAPRMARQPERQEHGERPRDGPGGREARRSTRSLAPSSSLWPSTPWPTGSRGSWITGGPLRHDRGCLATEDIERSALRWARSERERNGDVVDFDLDDIKPALQVQVVAGMYFDRRVFLVVNTGEKRPVVVALTPHQARSIAVDLAGQRDAQEQRDRALAQVASEESRKLHAEAVAANRERHGPEEPIHRRLLSSSVASTTWSHASRDGNPVSRPS